MNFSSHGGHTGERGQIAIFVALIFHVLFVFFAMVVNVGLLVHQKINLQNSVDLAAYYAAMKQAENMNAIAHVNYQIRQAWKLMVWRYRHLGMAGDTENHPYNSLTKTMRGSSNADQPFSCPATFCINHPVFDIQEPWEYYCRDLCSGVRITLLGIPSENGINFGLAEGILGGLARSIENASRNLVDKTQQHCRNRSALNWFALARFIFAYKQDMKNRKQVLNRIANAMSSSDSDLLDVDGRSVREGARKTFWKNLSPQMQGSENGEQVVGGDFALYNSLGDPNCSGVEGEENVPPKWLSEVLVKPIYNYFEGDCDGAAEIGFSSRPINTGSSISAPRYTSGLDAGTVQQLIQLIADPSDVNAGPNRLWHSTAHYEKNPWCMAYVGVEASASPKIPFSPFGNTKITARAFAKPFGGRIGPWYYPQWPSGSQASNGGGPPIDGALPPRIIAGEDPGALNDDNLRADFARYAGDQVGNKSTMTMGHVSQSIWNRHQPPGQANWAYYSHLFSETDLSNLASSGDMLAWNSSGNATVPLRDLEISFIMPDQFDISYFSIEPDFWRNYGVRLQARSDFVGLHVRGDQGYRKGAEAPWATMTVQDQLALARRNNIYDYNVLSYFVGGGRSPASAFAETLTSWHPQQPGDYRMDVDNRFGNCPDTAVIPFDPSAIDTAVPGNCFAGGRTGYSVKIVDGEYLQDTSLELGGEGQTGPLLNPWSDDSFK